MPIRALSASILLVAVLSLTPAPRAGAQCVSADGAFVNFEAGHVRPLALSPDGSRLFAVNTPDNRLAIYTVTAGAPGLALAAEVVVGLEPVAVAARTNADGRTEAWVVNHLSDSVSVVEVDPTNVALSRVTRTLLVGDEPRDIVFAGAGGSRAFVTCAHRGQNRPGTPQLTTPGVGRADVWAFAADSPGAALGGTPVSGTPLALFCDTPRALAVSPDGGTVYAAAFKSGNRTTTINELAVDGNTVGLLRPAFPAGSTPNPPATGLIVKFDRATNRWEDGSTPQDWSPLVPFNLPDKDVWLIDANATPVALQAGTNFVQSVGTVIFNLAVRPNGTLYASNLESQNHVRFEPTIHGHIAESRITVVNGTTPTAHHLNTHINYAVTPGPQSEKSQSLAFPLAMAFSADGHTVFVPGFGSGKVGAYDADQLEAGTISKQLIPVGQGPSGVVLDAAHDRLYVMNRIDHSISVVANASVSGPSRAETAVVPLPFDPSPPVVAAGRRFLYDASISGHGDSACASCHIFGDMDDLAWDLGDPFGAVVTNQNPFRLGPFGNPVFHPLKGPMTTQTLRGMADAGPMHWRGDRTGGAGAALDEDAAFKKFNPAFVSLLGNASQLSTADMQDYTDFILTVRLPPNPIRALNDVATAAQNSGTTVFHTNNSDGGNTCQNCHRDPLGTDGFSSFEGEPQEFKIAHLRNLYQKVGMFGFPSNVGGLPATPFQGDQVRGFGFLHDGSVATVSLFLNAAVFNLSGQQRLNLEQFALAFDTGLKPAVGQQVSIGPATLDDAGVIGRIDLLIARADAGDCDLVVKGNESGVPRGWVYTGGNTFQPDRNADAVVAKTSLRLLAGADGREQTYTCVPPGSGGRIGVDRDRDGVFDRTEIEAGSDPADPCAVPGGGTTNGTIVTTSLSMKDDSVDPISLARRRFSFKSDTRLETSGHRIGVPAAGSDGDPRTGGGTLRVYNSDPAAGMPTDDVTVNLVPGLWGALGSSPIAGYRYDNPDPNGPIKRVLVKADRIQVTGGKANWTYTLDEPAQGRVAVRLTLGTGAAWCAEATPRLSGLPPSTAASDHQDQFTAQPKSPAPAACPPPK